MTIQLYDISVASYLQTLDAVAGFMEKGRAHIEAAGGKLQEIVDSRIHPDMWPFRFQVISVAHHSLGAINGIKSGVFTPPQDPGTHDWAGLVKLIAEAKAGLAALDRAEVNAFAGKDMVFKLGERSIPFRAEDFVLSFSLPNFHFHAATAYDLLRARGVPIGKRDFLGALRFKR